MKRKRCDREGRSKGGRLSTRGRYEGSEKRDKDTEMWGGRRNDKLQGKAVGVVGTRAIKKQKANCLQNVGRERFIPPPRHHSVALREIK